MQGIETIYLVHRPNYHTATQRYQVIATVELSTDAQKAYSARWSAKKGGSPILTTDEKVDISAIDVGTAFKAIIGFSDG